MRTGKDEAQQMTGLATSAQRCMIWLKDLLVARLTALHMLRHERKE